MGIFGRDLTLEERLRLEAALAEAYAPLRERRAAISPARVRARVRWEPRVEQNAPLRGVGLVARLSEATVAFAVSALFFVGALGMTEPPRSVSDDAPSEVAAFAPRAFDPSVLVEDPNYIRVQAFSLRVFPIEDTLDAQAPPMMTAASAADAAGSERSVGVR